MDGTTLILNVAYLILLGSTFTKTILWLRAVLICSSTAFVVYGIVSGISSVAAWNAVAGVLHVYQLVVYLRARRSVLVSAEDEHLRQRLFPGLDQFDFATLWSVGEPCTYENEQLIAAGASQDWTALILDGLVEIRRGDDVVAELGPGALVGELSYISESAATADAFAIGPVRLRRWQQAQLHALDALNPAAGRAFHRFLLRDMASKIARPTPE